MIAKKQKKERLHVSLPMIPQLKEQLELGWLRMWAGCKKR